MLLCVEAQYDYHGITGLNKLASYEGLRHFSTGFLPIREATNYIRLALQGLATKHIVSHAG